MLPLALKIVWFVIAFLGIIASWIILLPFSRAIGVLWAPLLYCGAVTVLEGIFCLGMIWKMDTTRMPHAFCVAQAALIGLSSNILTGICACFTIATYLSVFKAQQLTQSSHSTLSWRPQYILLVVVYPAAAFAANLAAILKTGAVKPSSDMHCDANDPLWPRLLSYAGLPLLIAIPCFIVSTFTAIRVMKAHSQSQRYRYSNDDTPSFTRLPVRGPRRTSKRTSGNAGPRTRPTNIFVPANALGTVTVTASLDHNPESYPGTERDLKFKNDGATSLSLHSMSGTTATHPHGHHAHSLSAKTSETTIYAPFDPVALPPPPVPVPHPGQPPSPIPSVETMHTAGSINTHRSADTPSPITFAPVPTPPKSKSGHARTPSQSQMHAAAPAAPHHYSPPFPDPGALQRAPSFLPDADTDAPPPLSPSRRAPVSPDLGGVRAFHLPLRASLELPLPLPPAPEYQSPAPGAYGFGLGQPPAAVREEDEEEVTLRHGSALPWEVRRGVGAGDEEEGDADVDGESVIKEALEYNEGRRASIFKRFSRQSMRSSPRSVLYPAIWRIVTFQIAFLLTIALAALSTLIDLIRNRPPTAFGTQHVALVLAAWGPGIVFGHLPGVRRRLHLQR
ncbi:hypothetical protein DENSPDRAFT_882209 [Dentipellis sp. KUC8613]|nr:hypothetical protein DENSPDRAFT_882209 [Dentipellis sp. KUC8613]